MKRARKPKLPPSREEVSTLVFSTWGDPDSVTRDITLAVEAHARGFVYVRSHLRHAPKRRVIRFRAPAPVPHLAPVVAIRRAERVTRTLRAIERAARKRP